MNVLDRFAVAGVQFRLDGERVIARGPITDELRDQMRDAKGEITAELLAIESRRQRLLALLVERPGTRYAAVYDPDASPNYDVLAVAIPGATFEVRVPKPADSVDFACRLMQTLDRHSAEEKPA